jgi:hypothetical protein
MASVEGDSQHSAAGNFPIGQRVKLPGHFPEPVVLEAVRPIGAGYECRVRLPDGSPDEAIHDYGGFFAHQSMTARTTCSAVDFASRASSGRRSGGPSGYSDSIRPAWMRCRVRTRISARFLA